MKGAGVNRRQAFGGLLAASPVAPAWAGAAGTAGRATQALQVGLAVPAGSGSELMARAWVANLARHWAGPVQLCMLAPDAQAQRWCSEPAGQERLLVSTAWQPALQHQQRPPQPHSPPRQPQLPPPLAVLAVLARAPLALLADRHLAARGPMPWPAIRDAVASATPPWRCAMDEGAADASMQLLQALGLQAVQPLHFRGPAQLLTAVAGARVPLAVCTAAQVAGSALQGLPLDAAAGHLGDVPAAHQRGDVRVLALAHPSRLALLPDVPTLDEIVGGPGHEIGRCLLLQAPAAGDSTLQPRLRAVLRAG